MWRICFSIDLEIFEVKAQVGDIMAKWKIDRLAKQLASNNQVSLDSGTVRDLIVAGRDQGYSIKSEYAMQAALFDQIDRIAVARPEYAMIYAIPNGQYRPGQRMEPGIRAGYPDIAWDIIRGGYGGLRLELKYGKNDLSPDQVVWRNRLQSHGYYWACVQDSVEECLDVLGYYYHLADRL